LDQVVTRIHAARIGAAMAANAETVLLYYDIGRGIVTAQQAQGWGAGVIPELGADLKQRFPTVRGFSVRNLKYMRAFAVAWPDDTVVRDVLCRVTWHHNIILLEKVTDAAARLWYARDAASRHLSRAVMLAQITSRQYETQGRTVTNFPRTLPAPESDFVQEIFRDHYVLSVMGIRDKIRERDLEDALLVRLRAFFLSLGTGFSLTGSQYPLDVAGERFYLDLLLYHAGLGRHVVIDLKRGKFKPEYAGKMGFYLTVVDELLPNAAGRSAVGIILCTEQTSTVVEYTLRTINRPMGVATYETTDALPDDVRSALPSPDMLRAEIAAAVTGAT